MTRKELIKLAMKLTWQARKHIAKSNFAFPNKAPGPGSYPIHDVAHARAALHYVSVHGTPAEREAVRRKVYNKYPQLRQEFKERYGCDPLDSKIVSAPRLDVAAKRLCK